MPQLLEDIANARDWFKLAARQVPVPKQKRGSRTTKALLQDLEYDRGTSLKERTCTRLLRQTYDRFDTASELARDILMGKFEPPKPQIQSRRRARKTDTESAIVQPREFEVGKRLYDPEGFWRNGIERRKQALEAREQLSQI